MPEMEGRRSAQQFDTEHSEGTLYTVTNAVASVTRMDHGEASSSANDLDDQKRKPLFAKVMILDVEVLNCRFVQPGNKVVPCEETLFIAYEFVDPANCETATSKPVTVQLKGSDSDEDNRKALMSLQKQISRADCLVGYGVKLACELLSHFYTQFKLVLSHPEIVELPRKRDLMAERCKL